MIFKIVSIVGALICVVLLLVYLIDNSKWYIKWKHFRDLQHNHPEVFDINNYTL